MNTPHPTCEDPACAICKERVRQAVLKIERGLRPAGRLRVVMAKIKESARQLHGRGRS
jgi:hypothetical protein